MGNFRKMMAAITLATMISSSSDNLNAQEHCTSAGGCGYESAMQSCCLAPAIGLGIAAIAVIIAVGVHRSSHSH